MRGRLFANGNRLGPKRIAPSGKPLDINAGNVAEPVGVLPVLLKAMHCAQADADVQQPAAGIKVPVQGRTPVVLGVFAHADTSLTGRHTWASTRCNCAPVLKSNEYDNCLVVLLAPSGRPGLRAGSGARLLIRHPGKKKPAARQTGTAGKGNDLLPPEETCAGVTQRP